MTSRRDRPGCAAARSSEAGFTVVEALVAMAILAIAAVALIGVSEAQVARINGLETRTIALWVAENKLAELELSGGTDTAKPESISMLGRKWNAGAVIEDTSDPELRRVTISVTEEGRDDVASVLGGFVDARPALP